MSRFGETPDIQRFLAALDAGSPVLRLIRGSSGSGKSALLALVRKILRTRGISLTSGVDPTPGIGTALVIDDAHHLRTEDLATLTAVAERGDATVIVATEPRPQRPELRALVAALGAHGPTLDLRPLALSEIARRAEDLGVAAHPELITTIHLLTGGACDAVEAALHDPGVTAVGADPEQREQSVGRAVAAHLQAKFRSRDTELMSVLTLAMLGGALDTTEVAAVLTVDEHRARDLVDAARASGVVSATDALLPSARVPLISVIGAHRLRPLAQQLLTSRLDAGALSLPVARAIAETGVTDPLLAEFLCNQAASADPALAVTLYDAAVRAGAQPEPLALRRAEAAGLSGDLDTAVHLTDALFERSNTLTDSELAAAVRISASAAAQRGMLSRSAELYSWLGTERAGADAPIGAAVLLAAGHVGSAREMLSTDVAGPPTSTVAAATLLATGLHESITGSGPVAMNSLTRSLSVLGGSSTLRMLPDTSAAVTALLCLHCGELAHAESVLARANETDSAGSGTAIRHRLLSAWASMIGGNLAAAAGALDLPETHAAQQRDLLFLHGLRVGLARRQGDSGALAHAWAGARGVIAEYSVDLLSLLPLGELWLAAIRMGEVRRIAHLVDQARELLRTLGEPALWGSALHWYGVQAAILAEDPAELLPHARALGDAAATMSYASGLAKAGRAWLRVLREETDSAEVEDAARTLGRIGLPWDGARLASEAALRVGDTRAATALLQVARSLRQPAPSMTADPEASGSTGPALSEREAEVANLLLAGMTYREIGARLYISARTVEHHVARMRRRLGAESRSQLIAILRAIDRAESGYPVDA